MGSKEGEGGGAQVYPLPWLTILAVVVTIAGYFWPLTGCGFSSAALPTLRGEYARFFSDVFLPVTLPQLGVNMAGLLIIGATLERCVARWQWLVLYVCGGAFSGLVARYWHTDFFVYSFERPVAPAVYQGLGAGGAIMSLGAGLMGILYWADLLDTSTRARIFDNPLTMGMFKVSGGCLVALLLALVLEGHVDYSEDLAGGVFGLLAGAALFIPRCSATRGVKWVGMLLPVIALLVACTLIVCMARVHPPSGFVRIHTVNDTPFKAPPRKK